MAITYDKRECCGNATILENNNERYTANLYVGNCFLVLVKTVGDQDYLDGFFVDSSHMERCLENGMYTHHGYILEKISINKAKCRNWEKIVELLTEYLDDIEIKVYKEGNYTWHEFPEPRKVISDMRMRELAENSISYLNDECMLDEFLEDRGIELTEEEKSYFGIWEDNDEEY